jgi:ribosomal protein S18 acetylase RimI-like enzyme
VQDFLDNPVYESLVNGDRHLGEGKDKVRYFYEAVSPFAGFETGYENGFEDLHQLLPEGRKILFATRENLPEPEGWKLLHEIKGLQFVLDKPIFKEPVVPILVPLKDVHIPQMVALATLTKPGPFSTRTIEFGSYYGIFDGDKLVAMTGQRLHVRNYTEVSAVCTHPDHLGKGYAYALMQHQVNLILNSGQVPFLHVRADNARAIEIYERIGFKENGGMNFYFLTK